MNDAKQAWRDVQRIRDRAPLVHNITNYVVMNVTANALLAIGASPVMAHAGEELDEIAAISQALVINIGTLSGDWVRAMAQAGFAARDRGVPTVLDPVGAGASTFRTQTAEMLLTATSPAILRGNASEILALGGPTGQGGQGGGTKGVDSAHDVEAAAESARLLARKHACVVVVSGAVDYVTDGEQEVRIHNGHALMPRVTGMGCTATAITGAFAAVCPSAFEAATHAMAVMGIAGELAAAESKGPGSFQVAFLDALYNLTEADVARLIRITRG